jgi:hypothetical protein
MYNANHNKYSVVRDMSCCYSFKHNFRENAFKKNLQNIKLKNSAKMQKLLEIISIMSFF